MASYVLRDRHVLVTGASSGIGRELARCFAQQAAHCLLSAHPSEAAALDDLATELHQRHQVRTWTLAEDLAQAEGPARLHARVGELVPGIDVLVNCAGLLHFGEFDRISLAQQQRMLQVNCAALMTLMHLYLPEMRARADGRILNVSSVAAFQPTAHQAAYGATKAFVQSLSEAVREELRDSGVVVCTLNPPYTNTPMVDVVPKSIPWLQLVPLADPAEVARAGVEALRRGDAVCVFGWRSRLLHSFLPRFAPRGWMARVPGLALRHGEPPGGTSGVS